MSTKHRQGQPSGAGWLEGLTVGMVLFAVVITIGLVAWALDAASSLTILVSPDFTP
jgi:hypothetical protein